MMAEGKRKYIANCINGEFLPPDSNHYFNNYNPATGAVYSFVPDSGEEEVNLAVKAASEAFPQWSETSPDTRSRLLLRITDMIEQNLVSFAMAESIDSGKVLSLAKSIDISLASNCLRFFANGLVHHDSKSHITEGMRINYTMRHPIGIIGCISPWNHPLYLFIRKIAPALAAGNCVIAKPSSKTPMTSFMFSELCVEAGIPPGVMNVIHGYGTKVGKAIISHPKITTISFTGSSRSGKQIAKSTALKFKKISLEMGGKNPAIVFADCDYDEMMRNIIRSSFSSQGQNCHCSSRIFVARSIYEKFKDEFVSRTKKLKVGDPFASKTRQGAIVSEDHFKSILSYINKGKKEGGKILTGGKPASVETRCQNGWYIEPTIFEGLPYNSKINKEEILGPIVTIMPFDTEEEVLQYANSSDYGLSASIWTQNLAVAHRIAQKIECSVAWINCWWEMDLQTPQGGIKNSGLRSDAGWEYFKFFTKPKNVYVKM